MCKSQCGGQLRLPFRQFSLYEHDKGDCLGGAGTVATTDVMHACLGRSASATFQLKHLVTPLYLLYTSTSRSVLKLVKVTVSTT